MIHVINSFGLKTYRWVKEFLKKEEACGLSIAFYEIDTLKLLVKTNSFFPRASLDGASLVFANG